MARIEISGDQGIAYGALQAGVSVATSYPGSPRSSTIEFLRAFVESHGLHVEWSTNEKVAFETALGASIGGIPALMGCKGVGFNVALDPVMVANLTDVGAGLSTSAQYAQHRCFGTRQYLSGHSRGAGSPDGGNVHPIHQHLELAGLSTIERDGRQDRWKIPLRVVPKI